MFCLLLNGWNYFSNKYCNFAVPYFPFWLFLRHPDIKKQKLGWEWACKTKKMINHPIKKTCYKTKSNFSQFFFSHRVFFLFPYQSVCKFWKIDKISLVSFLVYKNGENLKMLIEIFSQNISSLIKRGGRYRAPVSKISGSAPEECE